jgi:RNA polymerase sigma factor (sigma-70 family)
MATGPLNSLVRQLRCRLGLQASRSDSDDYLLERFAGNREEAAFAALVERHGPTVLGVCRRVLGDVHDAEDAFQSTFLTLARKAGSIRRREAVASWLYRVAYRVAVQAKVHFASQRAQEAAAAAERPTSDRPDLSWRDLWPVLDEEMNRLPDKYRAPLVLCFLEGKTNEEAAEELGWPAGSVRGRVARARALLRDRLIRRGVTLPAAALATAISPTVVSAGLKEATVLTVMNDVLGQAVSAPVLALTEKTVRVLFVTRCRSVVVLLLGIAIVCGAVAFAWTQWSELSAIADDRQANPGPGELENPDGKPDDRVAEIIKDLVPAAAGMSKDDMKRLSTPGEAPSFDKFDNQTLTLLVLDLNPADSKDPDKRRDFRFLEENPNPAKLADSISRSQAKGFGSIIQPEFITEVTCRVKGDVAKGAVTFRGLYFRVRDIRDLLSKGEPIYEGCVEYTAHRIDGKWRVDEFRLPNYKIKVVRNAEGKWKREAMAAK